jgi:4-aminobutyrate aminotransferase-like enzyme
VLANCRAMGERIGRGLREIQKDFPVIGDIRQAGLHIGVELVRDPQTREPDPELFAAVRKHGLAKGIIFGLGGTAKNVLKIKPPLIITAEEADTVLTLFRDCLAAALR